MNNYGKWPRHMRKQYSRQFWDYAAFYDRRCVQPSYSCHRRRVNWYGVYHSRTVGIERRFIERRNRHLLLASWNSEAQADV